MSKTVEERERVVVRFAGDSGDGMQLTGDRFTNATALVGNDLATLPDFPAEIRAPAGTVHGVSAFQIQFASTDVSTPGDHADVLVAMNPAALRADLGTVARGGTLILNEDAFTARNIEKAGYGADPRHDGTLDGYQVFTVPMTSITVRAVEPVGVGKKEAERAKNMFALGLVSWMYGRPTAPTLDWLERKFGGKPEIYDANVAAFNAGYNFGETTELFAHQVEVKAAPAAPGTYRNVAGSQALAWGLVAASQMSGLRLFYASYPITPASDLLHELSRHKNFGVITVQAEDEIAAANMALGAAFAGDLAVTGTSGPGLDLKAETIGLAVITELPMIVVDVQRAGPSTGMPTKTEQGDLLAAMFGRHGESPDPDRGGLLVVGLLRRGDGRRSRRDPVPDAGDPVVRQLPAELLRAVALARRRGAVGDRPDVRAPQRRVVHAVRARRRRRPAVGDPGHARAAASDRGARARGRDGGDQLRRGEPRADDRDPPGQGRRHRGGDPAARGRRPRGRRGVCSCSAGARRRGRSGRRSRRARQDGAKIASAHLRWLNPMPANTGEVLRRYPKVLIPEINEGQLAMLIRAAFLVDARSFSRVQGRPIWADELDDAIEEALRG